MPITLYSHRWRDFTSDNLSSGRSWLCEQCSAALEKDVAGEILINYFKTTLADQCPNCKRFSEKEEWRNE